jgi:cytochrome d ubiquinol oxidase subunit II
MIPFALTAQRDASSPASLNFIFWGAGVFVMPLTLAYTIVVYRLFRGKVADAHYSRRSVKLEASPASRR